MSEYRMIYSTWPDAETAEAAARRVLDEGLAACANILPGAVSLYRWEGKIMRDPETVMNAPEVKSIYMGEDAA